MKNSSSPSLTSSPRIGFVSLGCPKALVDSERIITQLRAEAYELVSTYNQADLVIVNTCGFIESAVNESLQTIQEALNENGKVIITGCLGAKSEWLKEKFPEVLAITGPQSYEAVINAVHQHVPPQTDPFVSLVPPQGIKLTPRHYAYLKISEGCNHKCSFCIIPSMRGKLASRPLGEVMLEAERLVNAGVKELLIIAQDTSAYGVDTRYQPSEWRQKTRPTRFNALCEALGELGIWVRLHYVYPYPHVDEVIPLMAEGKLLPYLDIPFQHASQRVLRLMKRPASSENVLERLKVWRSICPDITIRSTFIVGFPGETEDDFNELLDFLTVAELDRVGCFQYSPVTGAKANDLPDPIADDIKEERYHRFMQHQAKISYQKLQNKVGRTLSVIVDQVTPEGIIARSMADAPEIDGVVHIQPNSLKRGSGSASASKNTQRSAFHNIRSGDMVNVKITKADDYDLYAKL